MLEAYQLNKEKLMLGNWKLLSGNRLRVWTILKFKIDRFGIKKVRFDV